MASEIDPTVLRCNACWRDIKTGRAYKTSCLHLFCSVCAQRFFGRALECPLCNASLSNDAIVELSADRTPEVAIAVFSMAAFHSEDAMRVSAEALVFARSQSALYGTREVWVQKKDVETLQRRVVEAENQLNTMRSELESAGRAVEDLGVRLDRALKEKEEERRKRKSVEDTRMGSGKRHSSDALASAIGAAPVTPAFRSGGGGGDVGFGTMPRFALTPAPVGSAASSSRFSSTQDVPMIALPAVREPPPAHHGLPAHAHHGLHPALAHALTRPLTPASGP
jgi:hypothetical protein